MIRQVPIQEAATMLGISESTLRRRLHSGQANGHQEETPQGFKWWVDVDTDDIASPASDLGSAQVFEQMERTIRVLEEQLKAMNQALSSKDQQITELVTVVRQAQAALPPPQAERKGFWRRVWGG